MKKNIGGIAAYTAAVCYLLSAAWIAYGAIFDDPATEDDFYNAAAPYVVWNIIHIVAGIAVVFVVNALRKQAPSTLSNVAFGFAIATAVTSLLPWAMLWSLFLGISFLLIALALRRVGRGVAGQPSLWDWTIPAAFLLSGVLTSALTFVFDDGSDQPFNVAFVVGVAVFAATLAVTGKSLSTSESKSAESVSVL